MDTLKKEHSLVIFLAYVLLVNIRPNHLVVDSIVLSLLFGYVLFEKFLKYKTLPDIRAEVEVQINAERSHNAVQLALLNERMKELEIQIKDTSGAVNKVIQMKSVNLAQSVKF